MDGLDYSVNPPRIFEIGSFSHDVNVEVHRLYNSGYNVSINVQQHGGKLFLAIRRFFAIPRLYETIRYGRFRGI